MGAAAVPVMLALTAASTGYGIYSTEKARSEAKKDAKRQRQAAEAQQAEMKAEQAKLDQAKVRDQAKARQRQAMVAAGGGGRRDSILTSPLGVTSAPAAPRKTLLGM